MIYTNSTYAVFPKYQQQPAFQAINSPTINQKANDTYLLAFDLDGTFLLGAENKNIIESFLQISRQKNCKLAYITGRSIEDFYRLKERGINIPIPDYYAARTGQLIYENVNGQMVINEEWYNNLSNQKNYNKEKIISLMDTFIQNNTIDGKPAMVYYEDKKAKFNVEYKLSSKFEKGLKEKVEKYLRLNGIKAKIITNHYGRDVTQKVLDKYSTLDQKRQLAPLIDENSCICEMTIAIADKSDALEFMRQKLAIDKDHVVAAGDSANDISQTNKGYWFIVVHNAKQTLIDYVNNLAPEFKQKILSPAQDGLAGINEALKELFTKAMLK